MNINVGKSENLIDFQPLLSINGHILPTNAAKSHIDRFNMELSYKIDAKAYKY